MNMRTFLLAASVGVLSGSALASPGRIDLRRGAVIPVVLQQDLTINGSREGDRFTAIVREDRDLPRGTRFEGRILTIQPSESGRKGHMDLEFTRVVLPDGSSTRIRAYPIPLDDRYTVRRPDGRFEAKNTVVRKENAVLAGAVGGLVIGSIFRRPFEGTFIGIAAGILAAESNSRDGGGVVLKRGDTIGAWFQDGVSISSRTDYGDRGRGDREPCRITYQDRELTFSRDSEPYRSGETVMVPVHRTAEQLGLEVETARSDRALFIQSDDCLLRIEPGSAEYRLNGRRSTLPCPTERRRGVLYAPIEAFAMMRSGTLAVNGTIVEDAS